MFFVQVSVEGREPEQTEQRMDATAEQVLLVGVVRRLKCSITLGCMIFALVEYFGLCSQCDSCVFVQVPGSRSDESQQEGLNKGLTVGPVRFFAYVLNAKLVVARHCGIYIWWAEWWV